MAKVALMTIFQLPNYGSVLQAYASMRVIEQLGHECRLINYKYPNHWNYLHGFVRPSALSRVKGAIGRLLNVRNGKVTNSLNKFRKAHLKLTRRFADYDALCRHDWSSCTVVTGSDQVWSPRFLCADKAFMSGFAPASVRKLSMASSFAADSLPTHYVPVYRKLLAQYSALSVREQNGANIITSQLRLPQPPRVMLDPTLLLTQDDWLQVAREARAHSAPYILVYELTYSFKCGEVIASAARKLQTLYGCGTVINLGDGCHVPGSICRHGCSVSEFLRLFANASAVITNSFHGTAFAVNAGCPLISIVPDSGDDRQYTLLESLGIAHCAVKANAEAGSRLSQINPEYDVAGVRARLEAMRRADIAWLKEHLPR